QQVVPVGEVHRLEQRVEPLLLAKKHRTEASLRAGDLYTGAGKLSGDDTRPLSHCAKVILDLYSSAADAPVGVRLLEMAARVIDDVPIYALLLDVIGQQGLREIVV